MYEANWDTITDQERIERLRQGYKKLSNRIDSIVSSVDRALAERDDKIEQLRSKLDELTRGSE